MKKIVAIIILVFFVFIIQNLLHSILGLWQKQQLLVNARQEVVSAQKENRSLKDQILAVKQPSFVEEQARDKLLLVKPGEQIVVVRDNLIVEEKKLNPTPNQPKPNWQLWKELFF